MTAEHNEERHLGTGKVTGAYGGFRQVEARPAVPPGLGGVGAEALPIWFAALIASSCQARGNGQDHDVSWDCESGRALYRNDGAEAEFIHPFGVCLQGGHTLSVTWFPGETEYTFEVFRNLEHCA
jgi:hypothetical protein